MSWLAYALAALVVVAWLAFAYWIGGLLRDARVFLERVERGECTCTRHRLCAVCLAELRGEQAA